MEVALAARASGGGLCSREADRIISYRTANFHILRTWNLLSRNVLRAIFT